MGSRPLPFEIPLSVCGYMSGELRKRLLINPLLDSWPLLSASEVRFWKGDTGQWIQHGENEPLWKSPHLPLIGGCPSVLGGSFRSQEGSHFFLNEWLWGFHPSDSYYYIPYYGLLWSMQKKKTQNLEMKPKMIIVWTFNVMLTHVLISVPPAPRRVIWFPLKT